MELLYKHEVYKLIGAAMEVHSVLGCGFLEPVYQEAFAMELSKRKIPFEQEKQIHINYKGSTLNKYYQADFLCYDQIIVELKALSELTSNHESQILNYLKATNLKVGLLLNFGEESLIYRRFIY
ncbi:MAG: GxxExxY protein [Bacteroidetes bacterium HGW-Bacteroidetes-15]|nr:MAG: GxxExxY protein [Bacteroidetes bacterium HGW-Bacteroidetes-15]